MLWEKKVDIIIISLTLQSRHTQYLAPVAMLHSMVQYNEELFFHMVQRYNVRKETIKTVKNKTSS